MTNERIFTLSVRQIIYIIIGLLVLYFIIIRPSVARYVCYNEAVRRDLHEFLVLPEEQKEPRRNRGDMESNVDRLYRECKAYNAGKVWEQFIFNNMQL